MLSLSFIIRCQNEALRKQIALRKHLLKIKCFKEVKKDNWPDLPYSFSTIDCCVRINHGSVWFSHRWYYTDGDSWRREHHGMFLSRGLTWYWGKIISPETKSRDLYSSRNIISNPKILGTFRDVPDNKVAICYIVWLPIAPIALPGFGIARRNLQNSVFFSAGIFFKLCAVQCVSIVLCAAVQRVSIVLCAQ